MYIKKYLILSLGYLFLIGLIFFFPNFSNAQEIIYSFHPIISGSNSIGIQNPNDSTTNVIGLNYFDLSASSSSYLIGAFDLKARTSTNEIVSVVPVIYNLTSTTTGDIGSLIWQGDRFDIFDHSFSNASSTYFIQLDRSVNLFSGNVYGLGLANAVQSNPASSSVVSIWRTSSNVDLSIGQVVYGNNGQFTASTPNDPYFTLYDNSLTFQTRIININNPSWAEIVGNDVVYEVDIFNGAENTASKICFYPEQNFQNLIPACQDLFQNGNISIQQNYYFSNSGSVWTQISLLNDLDQIITSRVLLFYVNEIGGNTDIPPPVISGCDSPSGINEIFFCKFQEIMIFLFVPNDFSNQISILKTAISNKIPFGYFILIRNNLKTFSETEAQSISDIKIENPLFGTITFFDWSELKVFMSDNFSATFPYFVFLAWSSFVVYIVFRYHGLNF